METSRFGVALSGGPDSVALLLLCAATLRGRVFAATVDHQLRAESADEARWCSGLCRGLGVPHSTLVPEQPITGNLQSQARKTRYTLLHEWAANENIDWILSAHHADDQAETLMMRLNRGAGISGLAGVRARNGRILRPLLQWRRTELGELVAANGIAAIQDPSNQNRAFDRVRMRQALAEADWIDPLALSRSASNLADAEAALLWMMHDLTAQYVQLDPAQQHVQISAPLDQLPYELSRRLMAHAIALLDPELTPRGEAMDHIVAQMVARKKTMIGNYLIAPQREKEQVGWTIRRAPPRSQAGDEA